MGPNTARTDVGVVELFEALRLLSPLRIIQTAGPNVFETICAVDSFSIANGWLNAITPQYHWHLDLSRFGHLTSRDTIHKRSRRQVLFFELRETGEDEPFLLIYLHRGKDEDFESSRQEVFATLHARCSDGNIIEIES